MQRSVGMLAAVAVILGIGLGCGSGSRAPTPLARHAVAGSVTGSDGRPLVHATVGVEGTPLAAVTNRDGLFAIEGVRSGTFGLAVLYRGFRSQVAPLKVPGGQADAVVLSMFPDARLGPARVDSLPPIRLSFQVD